MKCNHCDYESEQEFKFCPLCGTAGVVETTVQNTLAEKLLAAMQDRLFLAICILLTVSAGIALFSGSVSVISVLMTVFIWLIYAASRKGTVDTNHMRNLSGTIYAEYVINNVLYILLGICGVIIGFALTALTSNPALMNSIKDQLLYSNPMVNMIFGMITAFSGWLIALVILVAVALGLTFNILGLRKIHRLAKAAYQSVENPDPQLVQKAQKANTWLWVFGIFAAVGALSSLLALNLPDFLTGGSSAAAYIIAALLVKKYIAPDAVN